VTVIVEGLDVAEAPALSVATAVSEYVPAGTPLHVTAYGALIAVPMSVVPAKNSTFAIAPSASAASAVSVIDAGAAAVAPEAGDVSVTVGGALAGVDAAAVTDTLSKAAVASVPLTWLDTASPTTTDDPIANVSLPTVVQAMPSADSNAVMTAPVRVSLTHRGAVEGVPDVLMLDAASARRRWNATPFAHETSMNACADEGSIEPRIMTPAFVQLATFWTDATRATIEPSPSSVR
jgi:hypothetical protein